MTARRVTLLVVLLCIALIPWCIEWGPDTTPGPHEPQLDSPQEPGSIPEVPPARPAQVSDLDSAENEEPDPGLTVEGTVISQDGVTPVVGAVVIYWQDEIARVQRVGTRNDGKFLIEGLKPGIVELIAHPSETTDGLDGAAKVAAGEVQVRIVLGQRGFVRVKVLDSMTGTLVTGLVRLVEPESAGGGTLVLAEHGLDGQQWILKLWPGKPVRFHVVADGYRDSKLYDLGYDSRQPNRVVHVVLEPAPERLANLTLMPRHKSGSTVNHVQVTRHFGKKSCLTTHQSRGGVVELSLPPGSHDLEVWPGRRRPSWSIPCRFRLDTKPGERLRKEVSFVRGGMLVLRGPDPDAPPSADLIREGKAAHAPSITERERGTTWRRIGPLAPGPWTVRSAGYRTVETVIEVGQETVVQLETL